MDEPRRAARILAFRIVWPRQANRHILLGHLASIVGSHVIYVYHVFLRVVKMPLASLTKLLLLCADRNAFRRMMPTVPQAGNQVLRLAAT